MSLRLILTTLLLATILLASTTLFGIRQANAFDPGGQRGGGAVPVVVTGNWEFVNYQPNGGSYSPQQEINRDNVEFLELKWIFPYQVVENALTASQTGVGAPVIIIDGIVYVVKNTKAIHAIDALTGDEVFFADGGSQIDTDLQIATFPYIGGPGAFSTFGHVHAMNYYRDQGWLIQSSWSCYLAAWNVDDGSLAWEMTPEQLCGTNQELGNPNAGIVGTLGNQGFYSGLSNHPPAPIFENILVWPVMGGSGLGGRSSVRGYDFSDPQNPIPLWRTWLSPHADGEPNWAIEQCDIVNGNGWYFQRPEFLASGEMAINCRDVPDDAVFNDWMDLIPESPTFGKMHTSSAIATVWGNMPLDQETGIIYLGTGDIGPYSNSTNKVGPNLHGSGVVAIDVRTGDLVWWYATDPHDLWDQDCSWGGIIANVGGTKVLLKACKNGVVYALNAATGEPVWVYDSPTIPRDWGSGSGNIPRDEMGVAQGNDACCMMTKEHMTKPWMNCQTWDTNTGRCTDTSGISQQPTRVTCYTECIESDIAYDGERVYVGYHINRGLHQVTNVQDFGNQGAGRPCDECQDNGVLEAIDIDTGQVAWSLQLGESTGFRGGLLVTGGVVYAYATDGNLYMVNSETGELIATKFFGIGVNVAPTIGLDSEGRHKIFMNIGGGGGFFRSSQAEGSLAAFGLPDVLPEPEIVEVIVEVPGPERIVEVPGPERIVEVEVPGAERIVEVEVPGPEVVVEVQVPGPERIVEVPGPEVQIQTISPISYVAIGLGVVLIVISGVLFTRKRSA